MAKIIFNQQLVQDIFHLKIDGQYQGTMGQFYMLRGWDAFHPILSRPFSIFDIDRHSISFVYKVIGKGTQLLSQLKKEDTIQLFGPYGKGFPQARGKVALVGGGMGLASLFLAAKELKDNHLVKCIDIYLGFKDRAILTEDFQQVAHQFIVQVGGLISQKVDIQKYNYVFACGPEEMMKAIISQKKSKSPEIFISLERRMGCGLGACLSCTCKTKKGNRLICKDGPVFRGEEILFVES